MNSVIQFYKAGKIILKDHKPKRARIFINNILIKGLYFTYNNKKILLSVRKFMLKYLINLDLIFADVEKAEAIIKLKL